MKRLAVSSRGVSLPVSRFRVFTSNRQWALVLRGSVSLVFALVKGEGYSPAHEGIRRGGRHLRSGPSAAAKATFALTHPSNLREISARIVRASSTRSHGPHGGGRRSGMTRMPNALRREHAAIAQQRIQDSGEATGDGDDGH